MELGKDLQNLLLLGIGAAALTAEKGKEIVEELIKRGEITVEQGKALNEELKHKAKEVLKDSVTINIVQEETFDSLLNNIDKLSPEQLAVLKEKLNNVPPQDSSESDE